MHRLLNKAALITGGGAGIGAATAKLFVAQGAKVLLVDASAQALQATVDLLRQQFPAAQVHGHVANIADEASAQPAVDVCAAHLGGLDVLVNNAAMRHYTSVQDATAQNWRDLLDVNLVGTVSFCRAALPLLRASGRGCIVNVSSAHALVGRKGMGLYDASKAGLLALTRTLAFEEAEHGVRVNAVCPGSTFTDFHIQRAKAMGKSPEQLKTERSGNSLLGRWATPQEMAWPIVWLSSDEASFITGATLMADGGLSAM